MTETYTATVEFTVRAPNWPGALDTIRDQLTDALETMPGFNDPVTEIAYEIVSVTQDTTNTEEDEAWDAWRRR